MRKKTDWVKRFLIKIDIKGPNNYWEWLADRVKGQT